MPPQPDCPQTSPDPDTSFAYQNGDEVVWESSQIQIGDKWLDYPGQRTYRVNWISTIERLLPAIDTCKLRIVKTNVYVAIDPYGAGFVEASGQLAEMTYAFASDVPNGPGELNGQVNIVNATCAEYFLRVVITLQVAQDEFPGCNPDAGTDAGDSGTEASLTDTAQTLDGSDASDAADR
jgi:hypothetical protein